MGTSPTLSKRQAYTFTRLVNILPVGQTCVPRLLIVTSLNRPNVCSRHFVAMAEGCSLLSIKKSTPIIVSFVFSEFSSIGFLSSLKTVGVTGMLSSIGLGLFA